ncbi:unnamed protein product [Colletotrichum noveboracense]|uniref:Pyruvate carboxyltransferase domain-containing protein n=1 Tax=Colletotrichum noveboracense TaxID=2664923 RepID=A0A9W4RLX5_9PEZI|nr:unnamed protein product [Colletotrichum noveboracense]
MSATAVSSSSPNTPLQQTPSLVFGPKDPPLLVKTLGSVIQDQAKAYGDRTAVVVLWQSTRLTYKDLADRSKIAAKGLLELGLKHGDCVGIMAGNCYQYIELFLGAARIGCSFVVLHNTYSPGELSSAVLHSDCKAVFMASQIGSNSLLPHIQALSALPKESKLEHIVCLDTARFPGQGSMCQTYSTFLNGGHSIFMNDSALRRAERKVRRSDTLNLQFTSGTTGSPKAAVLTHFNLINDARFVGDAMQLTHEDVVCCPPPLFHCFGLVMGFLAAFCYGSSIIFPSDSFNAQRTIDAIINEKATALLGVPTMFIAELEVLKKAGHRISTVRTGLAAGSPVPPPLMESLRKEMQIGGMLIAYGMTETSPVTFITALGDTDDRMFKSLGKVLPHTGAKIVDTNGNIVPRGTRGEICTSGFALQKRYWKDEERTREVMRIDEDGVTWMHTGDEGFIDDEGYGHITGRIKDLIIRGGENISPIEIEARLLSHASVGESCVVGLDDKKYGEVVACFLKLASDATRPSDEEIRTWVTQRLGQHKAPEYIFWLGRPDVGSELPKTGSGKYQKHLVRELGNALVKRYVSCIFTDPFDGPTPLSAVHRAVKALFDMGCYEVSLGDTLGVGTAPDVRQLIEFLNRQGIDPSRLAGHFHETYGQALANVWKAYECGVRTFDSSVGGLGGCPFAPGAKGNVATEDVVYLFENAGVSTGVNLQKLAETGVWISKVLSKSNDSRAGAALSAKNASKGTTASKEASLESTKRLDWSLVRETERLLVYRSGATGNIVLNTPRNGNTLTSPMIEDFQGAFRMFENDPSISRIVISAKGKFFCTGMDLSQATLVVGKGEDASLGIFKPLKSLFELIDNSSKVTIACINGPAFGGGIGLAFSCDIRVCLSSATFTLSEVKLGLCPAVISRYVIREWGLGLSRDAMLTTRAVSASELKAQGAVSLLADTPTELRKIVEKLIRNLRHSSPGGSKMSKDLVRLAWSHGGTTAQEEGVAKLFESMMAPGCEAVLGIGEFQNRSKVDWDDYAAKAPRAKI